MKNKIAWNEKKGGFTLIEILIVISIIAILACLLFPVFGMVRKRASNSECLSNLRQIGIAISAYASDYDGRYPYACNPEDIANPDLSPLPADMLDGMPLLNVVLGPYVHEKFCWECPLDTEHYFDKYGTSYRYNDYLDEPNLDGSKVIYVAPDSSKAPLAFDASYDWHTADPSSVYFDLDYVNVIYEDNHVKRATWFDTYLPYVNN